MLGRRKVNNSFRPYRAYIPYFESFIIGGRDKQVGIWWPSNIRDTLKKKENNPLLSSVCSLTRENGKHRSHIIFTAETLRKTQHWELEIHWFDWVNSSFDTCSFSAEPYTPKTSMACSHSSYCGHQHPFLEFINSMLYKLIWISGFS